tara:strand:+ start:77 stop:271 length:195 start_codon:yes stop_codon:yes gene_type:complete
MDTIPTELQELIDKAASIRRAIDNDELTPQETDTFENIRDAIEDEILAYDFIPSGSEDWDDVPF